MKCVGHEFHDAHSVTQSQTKCQFTFTRKRTARIRQCGASQHPKLSNVSILKKKMPYERDALTYRFQEIN